MTARYLWIVAEQEPFDLGLDDQGRSKVVFNVVAEKTESAKFEEELIALLVAAGVGVAGASIFVSSAAAIPAKGAGPYLSIETTGGLAGLKIQNQIAPAYQRPGAKIVTRASTYAAARAMARAAYDALVAVSNQTVTT